MPTTDTKIKQKCALASFFWTTLYIAPFETCKATTGLSKIKVKFCTFSPCKNYGVGEMCESPFQVQPGSQAPT